MKCSSASPTGSKTLQIEVDLGRRKKIGFGLTPPGRLKFVGEQDPVVLFAEAQRRAARGSRKRGTVVLQLDAASMSAENTPSPSSPFKDKVPIARATSPTSAFVDLGDLKMQNN